MQFVKPIPFKEAVTKLGRKNVVTSQLTSAEWSGVPVAMRERAFFSSRIESARFLERAKGSLGDWLTGAAETITAPDGTQTSALKTGSRAKFVEQMRDMALAEGMGPVDPSDTGTIKDIRSERRLQLIFDTQIRQAHDYGNWKQGMNQAVLDEFPAQRFIRVVDVKEPRDYHRQFEGRVELKTNLAFWKAVNKDFNVPWGPWGWGCGHDIEDVDRDEAERLGLIAPQQPVEPAQEQFNADLRASVNGLSPEIQDQLRSAFGDQVMIQDGAAWWKGDRQSKADAFPPKPKPAPKTVEPTDTWPAAPDKLETVRALGGTTGATLVRDPATGAQYVMKRGAFPDHIREEFAADTMYRAAGVPVPESRLYEDQGAPTKLARYIEGTPLNQYLQKATTAQRKAVLDKLSEGFPVDALLANWDVGGTGLDNILVDANHTPWRIDNGGSLRYRAQGAAKADAWNPHPTELWTMRHPGAIAQPLYGHLDIYQIADRVQAVDLDKVVAAAPPDLRPTVAARVQELRRVATKALDMKHDGWVAPYSDDLTRHTVQLRKAGITQTIAKQLTQAPGDTTVVDEHGKPWDRLRSSGGAASDPYWNDLLAAIKTLNAHQTAGDMAYNQTTVAKALAHEQALTGSPSGMLAHYQPILDQIKLAKLASDAKRPHTIPQLSPYAQPQSQSESVVTQFSRYAQTWGGEQKTAREWMSSQGRHSHSKAALAYKYHVWQNLNPPDKEIWWPTGNDEAKHAYDAWMATDGAAKRQTLVAWHALVQDVLSETDFRCNDRQRRCVRLIRTEKDIVMRQHSVTKGANRTMPRALNESSSVFQTTTVFGSEITVQAVPHSRITGLYLLENSPGSNEGSFAGDSENEFTFIPWRIPFDYVSQVDVAVGSDAAAWGLNLDHLSP